MSAQPNPQRASSGFTVALAGLTAFAVLAAIVTPVIEDKLTESRVTEARRTLIELSRRMHGQFDLDRSWETIELRDGEFTTESFELAQIDPWGKPVLAFHFAQGQGGILLVSGGPDGELDSPNSELLEGRTQGDDLLQVVTHRVSPTP